LAAWSDDTVYFAASTGSMLFRNPQRRAAIAMTVLDRTHDLTIHSAARRVGSAAAVPDLLRELHVFPRADSSPQRVGTATSTPCRSSASSWVDDRPNAIRCTRVELAAGQHPSPPVRAGAPFRAPDAGSASRRTGPRRSRCRTPEGSVLGSRRSEDERSERARPRSHEWRGCR